MQRFKYRSTWTSTKSDQEGIIYFNVDVSRLDPLHPIELTYRFQGQKDMHRYEQANEQFKRQLGLEQNSVLAQLVIESAG
jgi:hypothetical protein